MVIMENNNKDIPVEVKELNKKRIAVIITIIFFILIALALSIIIPNMMETRQLAGDIYERTLMSRIFDAQMTYRAINGKYAPSMSVLNDFHFLQEQALSAMQKDGDTAIIRNYIYTQVSWTPTSWKVVSSPIDINSGTKVYTVSEAGKITYVTTSW